MSYITFNDIGIFEQLGSQMNNFAVGYAIFKRTGHKIAISKTNLYRGHGQYKVIEAFDYPFEVIEDVSTFKSVELLEFPANSQHEKISINNLNPDTNYNIFGTLHFPQKYWMHIIEDIQNNFYVFKETYINTAQNYINNLKSNKEIISIHFRRTDYLNLPQILNLSLNYYQEALTHFNPSEHKILIFSDDIQYCKTELINFFKKQPHKWDVNLSINNTNYTDMCMMSLCDHNIICNSTFSQWGALLNKNSNKKVICPIGILPNLEQFNTYETFKDWTILTTT